jgi:hypothetical protein
MGRDEVISQRKSSGINEYLVDPECGCGPVVLALLYGFSTVPQINWAPSS